jgi:hypothetical protein
MVGLLVTVFSSVCPIHWLLLSFAFGPCIINALTRFISAQIAKIKLQMLLTPYQPLGMIKCDDALYKSFRNQRGKCGE